MKTRFLLIVTLAATLLGVEAFALPGSEAHAQEVQLSGPLAGARPFITCGSTARVASRSRR